MCRSHFTDEEDKPQSSETPLEGYPGDEYKTGRKPGLLTPRSGLLLLYQSVKERTGPSLSIQMSPVRPGAITILIWVLINSVSIKRAFLMFQPCSKHWAYSTG